MDTFYDDLAGRLSDEYERAYRSAVQVAANAELQMLFEQAAGDAELRIALSEAPAKVLGDRGIRIPEELDVRFVERRVRVQPVPDVERFAIRLTNCRSYWVKKEDGPGYEQVEVCLGLEVVPRAVPDIG